MTKHILLVYPGKYGQFKPLLPLPLLYLSSSLLEKGYHCKILDMRLEDFKKCDMHDILCIGISTMSGSMIKYALEFAKFARQNSPKTPIIWGGIHPSLLPEQTIESPYVDVVVRGEGEVTLLELVNAIANNNPFGNIKGITFKENGKVISNPDRDFMDLNTISIKLPYYLFKIDQYDVNEFPINTSRGCPHKCSFCYNLAYNRRSFRFKSPERVLDETEYILKNFSAKKISYNWEDDFFANEGRVKAICEGIIKRGLKFEWGAFCRFDYASKYDEAFLKLLEDSGCRILSFGTESGSQMILDSVINKGIKIEQILETSKKISKTKIKEQLSFMSGVPGESYEDFLATCNLIDQVVQINPRADIMGIYFYTPFPGTPLMEVVKKKYNFSPPQSLEKWQEYRIFRNFGCTWLDKRSALIRRGVSLMTRFPFWTDTPIIRQQYKSFPYKYIYTVFSRLSRFRWKHRFFSFPIEWLILEKAMERWRGYV